MFETIGKIITSLLFGLIPPELNGEPLTEEEVVKHRKLQRRWRKTVHSTLVLLLIGSGVFILWSLGTLGWGGGFAHADAQAIVNADHERRIAKVEGALDTIAISQLRAELRELRRLHCEALKESEAGVPGARGRVTYYYDAMEPLREQYEKMANKPWAVPSCGDR